MVDGTLVGVKSNWGGRGVIVQEKAALDLNGAIIRENLDVGLSAADYKQAQIAGVQIQATEAVGQLNSGVGALLAVSESPLQMTSCRLLANRSLGAILYGADGVVANTVVAGTRAGKTRKFNGLGEVKEILELADGVLVESTNAIALDQVLIAGNARAGLHITVGQLATLTASVVTGGVYGLVSSGEAKMTVEQSLLHGNGTNVATGVGLALPPHPGVVVLGEGPGP